MFNSKNVLVATDTRYEKHPVVDQAALIAQQSGASIDVIDVVPEFPGIVRFSLNEHHATFVSPITSPDMAHLESVA